MATVAFYRAAKRTIFSLLEELNIKIENKYNADIALMVGRVTSNPNVRRLVAHDKGGLIQRHELRKCHAMLAQVYRNMKGTNEMR